MKEQKLLDVGVVFPSNEVTVVVAEDQDYGGAHRYIFKESLGHVDGNPVYADTFQGINFVKREESGMVAGIQSEQLLIALIDRHKKLNAKFPSKENAVAITHLETALLWFGKRVQDRINRGVMGELKK